MHPSEAAADRPLADRVAIVTGGSSGIGRAACVALARAGASVVAIGRSAPRLEETIEQVRRAGEGGLLSLALDVGREEDMARMAERVLERFGRIDILVASAGILRNRSGPRTATELTLDDWNAIIRTSRTTPPTAPRSSGSWA